jgi:hypothetical protein
MTPKIIELIIEEDDKMAGLDGIALVELPAHESNFEYFAKEEKSTHYVLSDEEIPQVIQMFHAYGEPQGLLEKEGFKIAEVKSVGKKEFAILADPNAPSSQDTPDVKFRYKYVGPKDAKNRTFCAEMMRANRVFRIEDIIEMSNRSVNPVGPDGYDMFEWRGSFNCRHKWVQLIYRAEGSIINKASVRKGLIDEDGMPGPDTLTTAALEAGYAPRTGFSSQNPDVSALAPYVDQVTKDVERKPVLASLPLFERKEDAEALAEVMGCKGSHTMVYGDKTLYMPCEEHPENEEFAEVGPRGGIRKSDKAPKSDTPNKNPQGEGTAKGDASGKRGAKVTAEQEKALQKKVDDFNEKDSNTKNGRATLGALKSVFQRGLGAFNVSHSPKVQSSEQWAYARVNAFLYLLKNGRPENPKYNTDYDLLPKDHPKAEKMSEDFDIDLEDDEDYMVDEFASYDDYPALISKNAQAALDYIERTGNPNDCMTQVGKVRAQQLAQGKPVSIETVKRMKSYISRHKVDLESSKSYEDGCGKLAMDAWGGVEALPWVERTIEQYENMSKFSSEEPSFSVFNAEQKLVVGPAMIPDKMIIRRNEITGEIYYVYFTAETIKKLQQKFMQEKLLDKTNIEHGRKFLNNVDVVESWIVEDQEKDKQQVFGMDYPKGTWMITMKVNDDATWEKVKDGKLKGFSVQGYFLEKAKFASINNELLEEIKQILKDVR